MTSRGQYGRAGQIKREGDRDSLPCLTPVTLLVHVGDTSYDDGSDGPEELQDLRSRSSEPHRHDLTTVSRCVGDLSGCHVSVEECRLEGRFEQKLRLTKIPQGIPSSNCEAKNTGKELAKNMTKIMAFKSMSPRMVAYRYPIRLVMGPAMNTPISAPKGPPTCKADCQLLSSTNPPDPSGIPYLNLNAGRATNEPMRNRQ